MTYCMKQSRSSPNAHTYTLGQLKGKRSSIIRDINSKALLKFSAHDIQILSWSLQAGLKYEELTPESKRIIDEIVPYAQAELKKSLIETIEKKWNKVSDTTDGMIPSFDQSSEDLISELGELGQKINKIRQFKKILETAGNDFETIRSSLKDAEQSLKNENLASKAPWSKINERVYARFITQRNFQAIGYVQIRVLPDSKNRNVSSNSDGKVTLDILSWLANPTDPSIQPLSFSMLYGYGGIAVIPALAEAPIALAVLLAVVLASQVIDWDKFFELKNVAEGSYDAEVRKALEEGINILNKTHDELEKPAKDAGVITGKMKNTSTNKDNGTREYTKPGGEEQLKKDFNKFPGETSKASDGTEVKTLPDGTRIVNRPSKDGKAPTLEIQPPKGEGKIPNHRIKVRYSN